ncbi:MAG: hypothetical protein DMF61_21210 [Blastocatellia bacterium AA13]|nr:MAG: hypothetical protein DMF61_21210 [Blastocatellia bacterium AA13]
MDSIVLLKRHENLSREAFDKLLAALDSNRDEAAREYERIRGRLTNFFEYRGCSSPLDYADITINCAAKKISEGREVYSSDPLSYFMGIARNILQEYWEYASKRAASLEDMSDTRHPFEDPLETMRREDETRQSDAELTCLEQCLDGMNGENRSLIVGYYVGERGNKIENRKRLAAELNVPPGNLRLKAFRLREKLENCVNSCLYELGMKQNPVPAN